MPHEYLPASGSDYWYLVQFAAQVISFWLALDSIKAAEIKNFETKVFAILGAVILTGFFSIVLKLGLERAWEKLP